MTVLLSPKKHFSPELTVWRMYVKFLTNSWMLRLLPETYRMHAQSLLDTNLTISAPSQRSNLEMGLKKLLSRFNFCPIFRFSWWLCFWFLCASPLQCSDSAIENPEGNIGCGVSSIWNQIYFFFISLICIVSCETVISIPHRYFTGWLFAYGKVHKWCPIAYRGFWTPQSTLIRCCPIYAHAFILWCPIFAKWVFSNDY